ncbi:MAG: hypothetical protein QG629_264 [Patescibacteria group bacterium]|nr:divalent metal cation transporter [Candidatus Saccharibacteria bacterium]MDQ5963182.1 hypothetical protein [Patescibacteria group bacterium]
MKKPTADPTNPKVTPPAARLDTDKLILKSMEMPAVVLDKTVERSTTILRSMPEAPGLRRAKDYWSALGPGLTTGASDDDPSGIATYSQAGAQHGFGFLWLGLWTFPLMCTVQEMCARIGMVTGRGLAGNIRLHFSKRLLRTSVLLLFLANAFNIGADLGAMVQAVQLIRPNVPFWAILFGFTALSLGLQIYLPYQKYAKYLKWLALVLLSYILAALLANINWGDALHQALLPTIHLNKESLLLICAILGTTISPYLFFWQTSQEVEEKINNGETTLKLRRSATHPSQIKRMRIDVWSGMLLSNIVMFFIIAACGGTLFPQGITNIETSAQAAEALRPIAGDASYWLFAIGIIGTGMLAIPVLAGSSSYALSEVFQWKGNLHTSIKQAHAFYGVIIISMLVGLGLNFTGINPIKALLYAAVANGIVAPLILFFIVRLSSDRRIMGHWVNRSIVTKIGWLTVGLMTISGISAIWAMI